MKAIITLLFLTLSLSLFAHGDHRHNEPAPMGKAVEEKRLPKIAMVYVLSYIKRGALEGDWSKAKFLKSEKKKNRGQEEWIVSFKNDKAKDKNKKTLYVFMRLDGKLIAANFKGK